MITDHNVRETLSICDRAYIISDGTVLASGKPDDLVNNEQVRSVYLGEKFQILNAYLTVIVKPASHEALISIEGSYKY